MVDSGAAENVMPKSWLPEAEVLEKQKGIKFVPANGVERGNYGRRVVEFEPIDPCDGNEDLQGSRRQD